MAGHVTSDPAVVLIVEDEPGIAAVIAEVVADAGYLPVVTTNGVEALTRACEQWPDLVMSDYYMPYLDGTGLVRALRVMAAGRGCTMPPIILMSGADATATREVGADAYLRKPFHLTELDALLQRYLG
jgi:CheY-like chemotaxis protein